LGVPGIDVRLFRYSVHSLVDILTVIKYCQIEMLYVVIGLYLSKLRYKYIAVQIVHKHPVGKHKVRRVLN